MDHSHVDIVCFQAAQHVLKGSPYLADVPRGFVLDVLPDGTQTVSYTPLDVYKRQVQTGLRRNFYATPADDAVLMQKTL